MTGRPQPRRPVPPGKAKPTLCRRPFAPDPDVPGDPQSGRAVCRWCQRVGVPGDPRHPVQDTSGYAAHDAAVLGEHQ